MIRCEVKTQNVKFYAHYALHNNKNVGMLTRIRRDQENEINYCVNVRRLEVISF